MQPPSPPLPIILLEPRDAGDIGRLAKILARIIWEQAKRDLVQSAQPSKDAA